MPPLEGISIEMQNEILDRELNFRNSKFEVVIKVKSPIHDHPKYHSESILVSEDFTPVKIESLMKASMKT